MIVVEALHHINVQSENIEKSVEFYTQFLDFDLIEQNEESASVSFEGVTIRLAKGNTSNNSTSALLSFILDVDDFTDALQEIEGSEITIVDGPSESEDGEKLTIKDPNGISIELFYIEEN